MTLIISLMGCNTGMQQLILLQVFLARGNVPADSYNFFIDILLNTIRLVGQSLNITMQSPGGWLRQTNTQQYSLNLVSWRVQLLITVFPTAHYFVSVSYHVGPWTSLVISAWFVMLLKHVPKNVCICALVLLMYSGMYNYVYYDVFQQSAWKCSDVL